VPGSPTIASSGAAKLVGDVMQSILLALMGIILRRVSRFPESSLGRRIPSPVPVVPRFDSKWFEKLGYKKSTFIQHEIGNWKFHF